MLDFLFGEKRIKILSPEKHVKNINKNIEKFDENIKNFKKEHQTTFILPKVTRVEVINYEASLKYPPGRVYVNMNCKNVELQYQDNFKTLKIFIK